MNLKYLLTTIAIVLFSLIKSPIIYGAEKDILFFYSDTCPHCHKEGLYLDSIAPKYPEIEIKRFEVSKDKQNQQLFKETAERLKQQSTSVPFLVIGDEVIIGYQSDEVTGKKIEEEIKALLGQEKAGASGTTITIPFIKKEINLKTLSLPALTALIGVLDGFNPCAMWVLLFLLGMLIGTKDKKRIYILGATFILVSGLMYFLFLSAWLNIFMFIGYNSLLKTLIGIGAIGIGIHYLNEYRKNKTGCEVTSDEKRQIIFTKIKDIINKNNLAISILGVILLATSINFVELLCSAGLPTIYTQLLASNNLAKISYYGYLLLYVLFFMIDDLIVFFIAITTLETIGISSKYTHTVQLIGGIVMFILGILMLFKPEVLMFN